MAVISGVLTSAIGGGTMAASLGMTRGISHFMPHAEIAASHPALAGAFAVILIVLGTLYAHGPVRARGANPFPASLNSEDLT